MLTANREVVKLNKQHVKTISILQDVINRREKELEASKYVAEDAKRVSWDQFELVINIFCCFKSC